MPTTLQVIQAAPSKLWSLLNLLVAAERFIEPLWVEPRLGNEPPPAQNSQNGGVQPASTPWAHDVLRSREGPTPSYQLATAGSGESFCA